MRLAVETLYLSHLLGILPLAPTFLPPRTVTAIRQQGKWVLYGTAQLHHTSLPSMPPAALRVPSGDVEPVLSAGQQYSSLSLACPC